MSGGTATWVERMWRGEAGLPGRVASGLLAPLESVFRWGVSRRNRRFDTDGTAVEVAPIPVISVGNLSVGGTGKTPVAAWVVRQLQAMGRTPGLLSRGYGADELALHRVWNPGLRVVGAKDRPAGARRLARAGCDSVVLDDGFQHRRLARTADIVLVSAEQGMPGRLLPRGPFREPAASLQRAQAVVVTRKSASREEAGAVLSEALVHAADGAVGAQLWLAPDRVIPLATWGADAGGGAGAESGAGELLGTSASVVVASSVASPASVVHAVAATGVEVSGVRAFRDHHEFRRREVDDLVLWAGGRPVVVTEKDAVKLAEFPETGRGRFLVVTQRLVWESGEESMREVIRAAAGGEGGSP